MFVLFGSNTVCSYRNGTVLILWQIIGIVWVSLCGGGGCVGIVLIVELLPPCVDNYTKQITIQRNRSHRSVLGLPDENLVHSAFSFLAVIFYSVMIFLSVYICYLMF
jgi:hypothetical protein